MCFTLRPARGTVLGQICLSAVLFALAIYVGCSGSEVKDHLKDLDRHIGEQSWQDAADTIDAIEASQAVDVETWRAVARKSAYDIAGEFGDRNDYHDRYKWVARAVMLLRTAAKRTDADPRILYDLGTILAAHIGYSQSPESQAFRKYFKADETDRIEDLGRGGSVGELDNLLMAAQRFRQAEAQLDARGDAALRDSFFDEVKPEVFFAQVPLCKVYYALMLENEGVFGERGLLAWRRALDSWRECGNREVHAAKGQAVRLRDLNVDYDFWLARCEFGVKHNVAHARRQLYEALASYLRGDIEVARGLFKTGFAELNSELERFPVLLKGDRFVTTLGRFASEYRTVRGLLEVAETPETLTIDKRFGAKP